MTTDDAASRAWMQYSADRPRGDIDRQSAFNAGWEACAQSHPAQGEAQELAVAVQAAVDQFLTSFGDDDLHRDAERELRELLWDNKVGIAHHLATLAAQAAEIERLRARVVDLEDDGVNEAAKFVALEENCDRLTAALETIATTFEKDQREGFNSRDRVFAIDIARAALGARHGG